VRGQKLAELEAEVAKLKLQNSALEVRIKDKDAELQQKSAQLANLVRNVLRSMLCIIQ
jgi:multidrug resistance efflux pump